MRYKNFSTINEPLSIIGLGCWGFSGGDSWTGGSDQTSIATIHAALDLGINVFDVAPVYGCGHAETLVGKAIHGRRESVFLASKCGLVWEGSGEVRVDLSRESIRSEIDMSLKRLATDYLDLYQMHWPDPDTPLQESLEALLELRREGKIRYIGLTNFSLYDIEAAHMRGALDCVQGLYNLLEHNASHYHNIPLAYRTRDQILPFCKSKGLPFLPYSPIMQGLLSGNFDPNTWVDGDVRKSNPQFVNDSWHRYSALAETVSEFAIQSEKPMVQLAINWLAEQEAVGPIICGALCPQQLIENAASVDWRLSAEQFTSLDWQISQVLYSTELPPSSD